MLTSRLRILTKKSFFTVPNVLITNIQKSENQCRSFVVKPTAAELENLSLAADRLWKLDANRLVHGRDYELDLQTFRRWDDKDIASRPLFKRVDSSVFERPTFKTFTALLDNYSNFTGEVEDETLDKKMEDEAFLHVIFCCECRFRLTGTLRR